MSIRTNRIFSWCGWLSFAALHNNVLFQIAILCVLDIYNEFFLLCRGASSSQIEKSIIVFLIISCHLLAFLSRSCWIISMFLDTCGPHYLCHFDISVFDQYFLIVFFPFVSHSKERMLRQFNRCLLNSFSRVHQHLHIFSNLTIF